MNIVEETDVDNLYKKSVEEELKELNFRAAKILCLLGIIIVPSAVVFDYLIPGPKHMLQFIIIRLLVSLVSFKFVYVCL